MKIIFWTCLGLTLYTYLIYPFLVNLLAALFQRKTLVTEIDFPPVSMVIPAYNEEAVLEEKINNCLAIDYPGEQIEFLFGSDGSSDRTNKILQSLDHPRIRPLLFLTREGKSSVLNKLVPEVEGSIVIFSDANSIYQPEAVKRLVSYFVDPSVGGVCGRLDLVNTSGKPGGKGEGLYWRFENSIKKAEGTLYSVISANGAIFAVRKELLDPLPTKYILNDDFMITLQILRKHKRVIYDPFAVATESTAPDMEGEFTRKIRISSLNFNAIPSILPLLHPRYGFTALSLFSHKILRWIVPFLGFGMLVSNFFLLNQGGIYPWLLAGQGLVYVGALAGYLGDKLFENSGPFIPFYYLAMINLALVLGLWKSVTRSQEQAWKRVPH